MSISPRRGFCEIALFSILKSIGKCLLTVDYTIILFIYHKITYFLIHAAYSTSPKKTRDTILFSIIETLPLSQYFPANSPRGCEPNFDLHFSTKVDKINFRIQNKFSKTNHRELCPRSRSDRTTNKKVEALYNQFRRFINTARDARPSIPPVWLRYIPLTPVKFGIQRKISRALAPFCRRAGRIAA